MMKMWKVVPVCPDDSDNHGDCDHDECRYYYTGSETALEAARDIHKDFVDTNKDLKVGLTFQSYRVTPIISGDVFNRKCDESDQAGEVSWIEDYESNDPDLCSDHQVLHMMFDDDLAEIIHM